MKTIITAISLLAIASRAQEVHDYRTVNGVRVDVGPVHEWFNKRSGSRPMSHWKKIQIVEIKGNVGGYMKCTVIGESGKTDLLIANLPRGVAIYFQSTAQQSAALAAQRQSVARQEVEAQRLHDVWFNGGRVEYNTSFTLRSGRNSANSFDSEDARLVNYNNAKRNLMEARQQLETLERDYQATASRHPEETTAFAMFTGKKYSGLDVWDCGAISP